MIVTVTLNPSLDRTIEVSQLVPGAMMRATGTWLDPGGKGVNVARALTVHGIPSCAVVPRNGAAGDELVALLIAGGIDVRAVAVSGYTRSNVSLTEPDGTVTKVNEPGGQLGEADLEDIVRTVLAAAEQAEWVVASGSLPPGVPDTFYAELGHALRDLGVRFAVDTSGPALRAALAAEPALVKPNRDELAEFAGHPITTVADVVRVAERMRRDGAGTVLASLGADGAVLVDARGVRCGDSPVDGGGRSSVGAGDAMLAGFLAAGSTGGDALVEALSWGAAAVRMPGSRMPAPEDVDRSTVRLHQPPDLSRPLSGPHEVYGLEQIR
ncbi:1-phosphofructokinase [Amycolatopsis suaedae]|uniref:1-phosphofructokinase n=2 Tax=Amycolatopsis suaedae TaxID=2510978 RepID=A0A4Q7J5Z2_9PSEU|nr:1-phosphofructokinase [Amycolatopsis suaedae]